MNTIPEPATQPVTQPVTQSGSSSGSSSSSPPGAALSAAQRLVGDIAPKLAELTDDVLFGDVWDRPQLARRDRSLITVATLVANGSTEQLVGHLRMAKANGLSETELVEAITHLAFYAGWPRAMSAITVAKKVFAEDRAEVRAEDRDEHGGEAR